MKNLLILLFFLAAAYVAYRYVQKRSFFDLTERIVVSQATGLNSNAGNTPSPKSAHIEGTIRNTSDKNVLDVLIIYTIGYDTVSASVGSLMAGDSSEFRSSTCRVRTSAPSYTLEEVKFEEHVNLPD